MTWESITRGEGGGRGEEEGRGEVGGEQENRIKDGTSKNGFFIDEIVFWTT